MSVQADLRRLEQEGLVQPSDEQNPSEFAFRHGLIQDAAYSTLLRSQRQRWHQAAGEVMEHAYQAAASARDEALAPMLAQHFAIAGDDERAVRYFARAGDAALARYANREAAGFYTRALDIARRAPQACDAALRRHLFQGAGRALEADSQYERALDNYAEMERAARERGDLSLELAAVMARATIYSTANRYHDPAESQRLHERAARLASELDDGAAQARIYWSLLLLTTLRGGDPAERIRYGELSLGRARALNLREQLALTLTDIFYGYAGAGQWEQARQALEEAVQVGRELNSTSQLPEALGRLALVALGQGDYDQAIAYSDEAFELARTRRSLDQQALSRAMVGGVYFDRGQFDQALELMQAAVEMGAATGNVTALIGTRSDLGRVYGELGAADRGLALAQQALAEAEARFPLLADWARSNVVRLHLQRDDLAAAEAAAAALAPYQEARRNVGFIPHMWIGAGLAAGELALARGDPGQAADFLASLIEKLEADTLHYGLPDALYLRGLARLAHGHLAQARADLRSAQVEAQALGATRLQWHVLAALAEIAALSGSPETATDLRRQARRLVHRLAEHVPAELRTGFMGQPRVRAILEEPHKG